MKTSEAIENSATVSKGRITPGAGVNPDRVMKVGKRVRNLHRNATSHKYQPLRAWCFEQIRQGSSILKPMSTEDLCTKFLKNKGVAS